MYKLLHVKIYIYKKGCKLKLKCYCYIKGLFRNSVLYGFCFIAQFAIMYNPLIKPQETIHLSTIVDIHYAVPLAYIYLNALPHTYCKGT